MFRRHVPHRVLAGESAWLEVLSHMMGVPSSENVLQVTCASQGDTFAELEPFTTLGLFCCLSLHKNRDGIQRGH
jgi:hypothetical protein